jgi:hypothetical protein
MTYAFIILLVAGIFLYAVFRKPSGVSGAESEDTKDDMLFYDPQRAALDDQYAQHWDGRSGIHD